MEFTSIPYEAQLHIISFLPQGDVANLIQVSSSIANVAKDNFIWQPFFLNKWDHWDHCGDGDLIEDGNRWRMMFYEREVMLRRLREHDVVLGELVELLVWNGTFASPFFLSPFLLLLLCVSFVSV
jgi:hypothetical protein